MSKNVTFEIFDFEKQMWVDIKVDSENCKEFGGYIIDNVTVCEDEKDIRIRLGNNKIVFKYDDYDFTKHKYGDLDEG